MRTGQRKLKRKRGTRRRTVLRRSNRGLARVEYKLDTIARAFLTDSELIALGISPAAGSAGSDSRNARRRPR